MCKFTQLTGIRTSCVYAQHSDRQKQQYLHDQLYVKLYIHRLLKCPAHLWLYIYIHNCLAMALGIGIIMVAISSCFDQLCYEAISQDTAQSCDRSIPCKSPRSRPISNQSGAGHSPNNVLGISLLHILEQSALHECMCLACSLLYALKTGVWYRLAHLSKNVNGRVDVIEKFTGMVLLLH